MKASYDAVVVGAGNAGQAAARAARAGGMSVLVVEAREVGGTCPLRGCVPKKVLVAASEALDAISRASEHGIVVGPPRLDWAALIDREQGFVRGVPDAMRSSLEAQGIDVALGRARFVAPGALLVGEQRVDFGKAVISTGSVPRPLGFEGAGGLLTSEDLLVDRTLPASLVFIGGGVIAFEFTHVLARAGVRVTVLETGPRPLAGQDPVCVDLLVEATRALGVTILTDAEVRAVEPCPGGFRVRFAQGGAERVIEAERVAHGAGRMPDVERLDLDAAGVAHEGAQITVDPYLRSASNPAVFVAGDALAHRPQLSALATYEGKIVGHNLGGVGLRAPDFRAVPAAIYTTPQLAWVGLTEREARERGLDFELHDNDLRSWRSSRTYAERHAHARVLVERGSDQVLGAHLLGHGAAETIHAFASALRHGQTAAELREAVYAYPTFHADIASML